MGAHIVQFYENDSFLVDEVTCFIGEGLKAGEAGIVIATPAHRKALENALRAGRVGRRPAKPAARSKAPKQEGDGLYFALDAEEALSRILVNGWPDERRFREFIGGAVARSALAGNGGVRAFGEMVALLWEAGQRDAAIRVEDLWTELAKRQGLSRFCAYPMSAFANASDGQRLLAVCNAHTHVHPPESFPRPTTAEQLNRMIVQLQHQAAALKAEVARRAELEESLRRRETELSDFLKNAAETARRKNEFLAMLGHELRNPLAPIANALELMRMDGSDAARLADARRIIERQTALMRRMVDDLLDVSRMASGKMELKRETLLLGNVVERAIELARPLIDEKGHQLSVDVPAENIWLHGDVLRLAQVLANLLNNAAKYTERGGRIVLTAGRRDADLVLSVRDNGMGLEPALREQVFEPFVQGQESLARSKGGLGIGLTLVRRIVHLHGGTVQAHSAGQGQGSEFVVRLPLAAVSPDAARVRVPRRRNGRPHRILVVDDNVEAAETLAQYLRYLDHQVSSAHDAASAIQRALLECPDVIILDIGLPEMDGYEVARRLRALPQFQSTVLIALTGYAQESDVARAKQCGFDHHLSKPLDMPSLSIVLQSRKAARRRPASQSTQSPQLQ